MFFINPNEKHRRVQVAVSAAEHRIVKLHGRELHARATTLFFNGYFSIMKRSVLPSFLEREPFIPKGLAARFGSLKSQLVDESARDPRTKPNNTNSENNRTRRGDWRFKRRASLNDPSVSLKGRVSPRRQEKNRTAAISGDTLSELPRLAAKLEGEGTLPFAFCMASVAFHEQLNRNSFLVSFDLPGYSVPEYCVETGCTVSFKTDKELQKLSSTVDSCALGHSFWIDY